MIPSTQSLLLPVRRRTVRGPARRILENTARDFLIERLAGAPLFIADANSLEYLAVRFGGKFQSHCEHNIIGRKRSVPVFEIYFRPAQSFNPARGRAIHLYLSHESSNLCPVGPRIHPQLPS